jgi:glycerophosphoryl diester phosphodiesterase
VLQNNPELNLYLMTFDLKNTDNSRFHFEEMQKIIIDNFSSKFPDVTILFTTPDDFDYLINYVGPHLLPGQAIGTDEFNKPAYSDKRFKASGYPYIYAHGNSTIFNNLYAPISQAVNMRNRGDSFRLVYPWVVNLKHSFRRYLNIGVDGIMTNKPARLKKLIEEEYSENYELSGYLFDGILQENLQKV